MIELKCRSLAGVKKSFIYFLIDASGGLISVDRFIVGMPGEKMKIIGNLKHKGAHPLTSADHRNSSQAGPVKNWRKGPCRAQRRGIRTAAGAPRRVSIRIGLHPSRDYFIPLFTAKVKKTELSFLRFGEESKLRCSLSLPPSVQVPAPVSDLRYGICAVPPIVNMDT